VASMQEFRRMLEETKKEVREIRAMEAQMKWNMSREEKKDKVVEEKEADDEIRDWRWRQSDEMKAYTEEKEQEIKTVVLQESKDFQEFKREKKAEVKIEEQRYLAEVYEQDLENAALRAEAARELAERDHEVTADRLETQQHLREVKVQEKHRVRAEADDNRALEQNLEMSNLARELAREKEQLLESLELTRAATRMPPGRSSASGRSSAMGRSRP